MGVLSSKSAQVSVPMSVSIDASSAPLPVTSLVASAIVHLPLMGSSSGTGPLAAGRPTTGARRGAIGLGNADARIFGFADTDAEAFSAGVVPEVSRPAGSGGVSLLHAARTTKEEAISAATTWAR